MNKGLKLLKDFQSMTLLTNTAQRKLKIIEKELEALEIIKKHTKILKDNGCIVCVINPFDKEIIKEEYDLLKEVLL